MAVATTVTRTPAVAYGDDTGHFKDYLKGDVLELLGADNATVTMPDIRPGANGTGSRAVGLIQLDSAAGSNANTFALPNGVHGQQIMVVFKTKTGGNAVLVPDSGVTIVSGIATAVASVTFSAANKFALLTFLYNRWVLGISDGTVA